MYTPQPAVIEEIREENSLVKTFRLTLAAVDDGKPHPFLFQAGQFVMLSVPGFGEAPISISSLSTNTAHFDLTIRKAGSLTNAVHGLRAGDRVGVRGPYGRPFPMDDLLGQDLLLVAGGIGLAPLKGVLDSCLAWKKVKNVSDISLTLCYGSRTPEDMIFRDALHRWREQGVECRCTVDRADEVWLGPEGLVTELLADRAYGGSGYALVCGPPVMMRAVTARLRELGWPPEQVLTTLERHMKCGVGVCRHCHVDGRLVCTDGPVFSLAELREMGAHEAG